ncbi:MAG: hypothetical protein ACK5MD_09675 [Flavobacteriales bacterium]
MKVSQLIILFSSILFFTTQCSEDESIIRDLNGNAPPTASNPHISGTPTAGQILKGIYTYSDKESDQEGGSEYKWYRADDVNGLNKTVIPNATDTIYTTTNTDTSKFLSFEVTPVQAFDNQRGETATSSYVGIWDISSPKEKK